VALFREDLAELREEFRRFFESVTLQFGDYELSDIDELSGIDPGKRELYLRGSDSKQWRRAARLLLGPSVALLVVEDDQDLELIGFADRVIGLLRARRRPVLAWLLDHPIWWVSPSIVSIVISLLVRDAAINWIVTLLGTIGTAVLCVVMINVRFRRMALFHEGTRSTRQPWTRANRDVLVGVVVGIITTVVGGLILLLVARLVGIGTP
jgi:hypothetical protein